MKLIRESVDRLSAPAVAKPENYRPVLAKAVSSRGSRGPYGRGCRTFGSCFRVFLPLRARRWRRRSSGGDTMLQHRFGNRIRHRFGLLEQSQQRQDHEEEGEIVGRENACRDDITTCRLPRPQIAEANHGAKEDEQKL